MYRDGVSEGQFDQVLAEEYVAMRRVSQSVGQSPALAPLPLPYALPPCVAGPSVPLYEAFVRACVRACGRAWVCMGLGTRLACAWRLGTPGGGWRKEGSHTQAPTPPTHQWHVCTKGILLVQHLCTLPLTAVKAHCAA